MFQLWVTSGKGLGGETPARDEAMIRCSIFRPLRIGSNDLCTKQTDICTKKKRYIVDQIPSFTIIANCQTLPPPPVNSFKFELCDHTSPGPNAKVPSYPLSFMFATKLPQVSKCRKIANCQTLPPRAVNSFKFQLCNHTSPGC